MKAGIFTVGYCTVSDVRRLHYWSMATEGRIGIALIEVDTDECGTGGAEIPNRERFERYGPDAHAWKAEVLLGRDNADEIFHWIETHTGGEWSMTEVITDPLQSHELWRDGKPMRFEFSFDNEMEAVHFKLAWG